MLAREIISIDSGWSSEIFIIADELPILNVCRRSLADANTGEDSACVLITTSKYIAEMTIKKLKTVIKLATKKYATIFKKIWTFCNRSNYARSSDLQAVRTRNLEIMTKIINWLQK